MKKCKNFLATLIKLASSGPQAPEMGQNVKNLVQNLLVRLLLKQSLHHLCIIFDIDFIIVLFELDLWLSTSDPL